MKHSVLYFVIVSTLVVSCSIQEKDFEIPNGRDEAIFYASFERPTEIDTKVYANEDLLLRWNADDCVSIFNKNTYNQQYQFTGKTGANAGGFKKVDTDEFVTGNAISHVVSVYPYQESTEISEGESLTLDLPAEQHYAEGTFGLGANTMVSVSEDNFLQFKNVGGYLRISLYGEGVSVSSITLKGNNDEKLAGKASVTMPLDGIPSVVLANDAMDEITLVCDAPVALGATADESVDFWFVVPPVTFSEGFTITVNDKSGGTFEKSTSKSITIERNKLSKMSQMEVVLQGQPNNEIWYTTSDGNPVQLYTIDFDAIIIANEYKDGQGIITFSDDVTRIGDFSFGWTWNLTSISLPGSVVSIGDYAFCGSQLTSVFLPKALTSIGRQAFEQCVNLKDVAIPENVISIGDGAFAGCSSLTSFSGKYASENGLYLIDGGTLLAAAGGSIIGDIILPSWITDIQGFTFENCSKMTSIILPANLTSIGNCAFEECLNLTSITIPEQVTTICPGAFAGCSSLTSFNGKYASEDGLFLVDGGTLLAAATGSMVGDITLPKGITVIQGYSFFKCSKMMSIELQSGVNSIGPQSFMLCSNLIGFVIPNSVTSIGNQAFSNCTSLLNITIPEGVTSIGGMTFEECRSLTSITLKPETPPTAGFGVMYNTNDCPIYVPAESVQAYKTAEYWSEYADRIQTIPSPHVSVPEAIDLGLPSGLKWASFNLGASKPEESGDYYTWGETEQYFFKNQVPLEWKEGKEAGYTWDSYKWCIGGDGRAITKYCSDSRYGYNGFTDEKTTLDLEDDAAHVNLGGEWRMPTHMEWNELRENCTRTWIMQGGEYGYKLTSKKNGNSIFFPAAGYFYNTYLYSSDLSTIAHGQYWSSSLCLDSPDDAYDVWMDSGMFGADNYRGRYYGQSIRPVCD